MLQLRSTNARFPRVTRDPDPQRTTPPLIRRRSERQQIRFAGSPRCAAQSASPVDGARGAVSRRRCASRPRGSSLHQRRQSTAQGHHRCVAEDHRREVVEIGDKAVCPESCHALPSLLLPAAGCRCRLKGSRPKCDGREQVVDVGAPRRRSRMLEGLSLSLPGECSGCPRPSAPAARSGSSRFSSIGFRAVPSTRSGRDPSFNPAFANLSRLLIQREQFLESDGGTSRALFRFRGRQSLIAESARRARPALQRDTHR